MRRRTWRSFLVVCTIFLVILGIILVASAPQNIGSQNQAFEMTNETMNFRLNPHTKVYFFNLTNPEEFLAGEKPILDEIGPYVFDEIWEELENTPSCNGTSGIVPAKKFVFNRQASKGEETDLVQIINVPMMTGGFYTQHDYVERQSYTSFIGSIRRLMPYVSLTVSDLLWGYEDVLIKITRKLGYLSVPRDAFGFFLDRNASGTEYARIESCTSALSNESTVEIFNPEICATQPFSFEQEINVGNLTGYRFAPPVSFFDNFNTSNAVECKMGIRLSVSYPHFLGSNPKLVDEVVGLKPDHLKHNSFFDFEPELQIAFRSKVRLQINLIMNQTKEICKIDRFRDMVFPMLWYETGYGYFPEDFVKVDSGSWQTVRSIGYAFLCISLLPLLLLLLLLIKNRRLGVAEKSHLEYSLDLDPSYF